MQFGQPPSTATFATSARESLRKLTAAFLRVQKFTSAHVASAYVTSPIPDTVKMPFRTASPYRTAKSGSERWLSNISLPSTFQPRGAGSSISSFSPFSPPPSVHPRRQLKFPSSALGSFSVVRPSPCCVCLLALSSRALHSPVTVSASPFSTSTSPIFAPDKVNTHVEGTWGSQDYKVYFSFFGSRISPWHDIPLNAYPSAESSSSTRKGVSVSPLSSEDQLYHMIVEIPQFEKVKMEIATSLPYNPIKQDLRNGKELRYYHGPIFWNYGALPQTWEDPDDKHPQEDAEVALGGDNDPLDAVDISFSRHQKLKIGEVVVVKVLGALCLIDKHEIDWKILVVDIRDPHIADLREVEDIDKVYPGTTSGIREWFRWYKTPDGKAPNTFAYNERLFSHTEAEQVIARNHEAHKKLLAATKTKKAFSTGLWLSQRTQYDEL